MATLITADLHLNDNPRDQYRHDWFQLALPSYIKKYAIDRLLILGDLTEEKNRHSDWLVNQIVDTLFALGKLCPVIILRGNHDYINPEYPFFAFASRIQNVTWINRPRELGYELWLPHTRDFENEWEIDRFSEFKLIYAHNTFQNARSEHGFQLDGIPLSVFRKSNTVISGDVHVPQTLGPVTYVGAPYTIDFGDDFEPRVLRLYDGNHFESIRCAGPQKRLVQWNGKKWVSAGDVVKVEAEVDDPADWPKIKDEIYSWGERVGVTIFKAVPIMQRKKQKLAKRQLHSPKEDAHVIKEYAKATGLDEKTGLKYGQV